MKLTPQHREFLNYMAVFFLPSSTPLYILFHDVLGMSIIEAYISANVIGGIACYYLFKQKLFEKAHQKIKETYEQLKEVKCIIIMKQ